MFHRSCFRVAVAVTATALLGTACGTTADSSSAGSEAAGADEVVSGLRVMVPNNPGGGYDVTARTATRIMEEAELAERPEVFNLAGAGGTVGLSRVVNEAGNGDLMMMMGLGVVGAVYTNNADATLTDTTPIAQLIEEPGIIVVPADSPYQSLDDLLAAWEADPGAVTVGGASSPGGPDHLLPHQLAEEVGIDPTTVNYVGYDSGGELLPAILGSQVAFGASGVSEYLDQIEQGSIRALAVTSEERVDVLPDVPTLTEQGTDLVFTNWRGLVAPPELDEAEEERLVGLVEEMHASEEWQQALEDNGWIDAFKTGDEFATFLTEQDERVADTLASLGLA